MQILRYTLILSSVFLLASCGTTTPPLEVHTGAKTPYFIEVFTVWQKTNPVTIEKTGRITASSSLTLTAQGAGEVGALYVKEWQSVKAGAIIATLKDTVNNYDLRYQQAQAALRIQDASIATTKVNLEQAVDNARINLEKAKQALDTLTGKNALSYDTLVNANSKTLTAYNENYKTYLSDTERLMTQLLYEGDKILGMTINYQYQAQNWRPYLGAQIGNALVGAENAWNSTFAMRWDIRARIEKGIKLDSGNIQENLEAVTKAYAQSRAYVDAMLFMLQNNAIGGPLGPEMNATWNATWNGFRSSVQAAEAQYNGWKSQTITFFNGYKNTESATELAVISLSRPLTPDERTLINSNPDIRVNYDNALLDLKDRLSSVKLAIEQAETSYRSAQSLRDATLAQMQASRQSANISLAQAGRDYAKLRITAPVSGTVRKVITSIGQQVNIGSPIADFDSTSPQIVMDVEPSIVALLSIGESLVVKVDGTELKWVVTALSPIANANLLSTIRIALPDAQKYIGRSALIEIKPSPQSDAPIAEHITLPLDALSIISEWEAEIRISSGTGVVRKNVKIGQILGDTIEILDAIPDWSEIIITSLDNYDPEKNILEKKIKKSIPTPILSGSTQSGNTQSGNINK